MSVLEKVSAQKKESYSFESATLSAETVLSVQAEIGQFVGSVLTIKSCYTSIYPNWVALESLLFQKKDLTYPFTYVVSIFFDNL